MAIFVRQGSKIREGEKPHLPNLVPQSLEDGEVRLVDVEPVAPSQACDYDLLSLAMYGGSLVQVRKSIDPVDAEAYMSNLLSE